jgi:hypothetical protein
MERQAGTSDPLGGLTCRDFSVSRGRKDGTSVSPYDSFVEKVRLEEGRIS